MTSDELNAAIGAIESSNARPPYECFGGKCVPYIGWFWRDVDFDAPTCSFGIMPAGTDEIGSPATAVPTVGFCENNKWGYEEIEATPEQFANIKRLLIEAVTVRTADAFRAVNEAVQGVLR